MALFRGVGGGGQTSAQASADEVALLVVQAEQARDAAIAARALAEAAANGVEADALAAAASAAEAAADETAAAASAAQAALEATNAATSETNAANSATQSAASATASAASATDSANSATASAASATQSATSATASATSASAALASEVAAATSELNAATSATNAAGSATNAANSATASATSATASAASATAAAASATDAANSATDAANSAALAATFDPANFVSSVNTDTFTDLTGTSLVLTDDINTTNASRFQGVLVGRGLSSSNLGSLQIGDGASTLSSVTTGSVNMALGNSTLTSLTTGGNNVAVGTNSGQNIVDGNNNVSVGRSAGRDVGSGNTCVGHQAGALFTGDNNTVFGAFFGTNGNNGGLNLTASDDNIVISDGNADIYWHKTSAGDVNVRTGGTVRHTIDANGDASFTNSVTAPTFIGNLQGNADSATTATSATSATTATNADNANLLDNIDSTQFLRSDQTDTFTTLNGNTIDVQNLLVNGAPFSGGYTPPIGSMTYFPETFATEYTDGALKFLRTGNVGSTTTYPSGVSSSRKFLVGLNTDTPDQIASYAIGVTDIYSFKFARDGSHIIVADVSLDRIGIIKLSVAWDIKSIVNVTYFVYDNIGNQETSAFGVAINNDGTRMYFLGPTDDLVYQVELLEPYNAETAIYKGDNFNISAQEGNSRELLFDSTGSRMYITGQTNDTVYQYSLSTPFDVTTASFSTSLNVAAQDGNPVGMSFNSNGTRLYITGDAGNEVNQYNLSSAYNINTASFSTTFTVSTQDTNPAGIQIDFTNNRDWILMGRQRNEFNLYRMNTANAINTSVFQESIDQAFFNGRNFRFNNTGNRIYFCNNLFNSNAIYQIDLNTAWDLTSQTGSVFEFNSGFTGALQDIDFNANGTVAYILINNFDTIYKYNLSTAFDLQTATRDTNFEMGIGLASARTFQFVNNGNKILVGATAEQRVLDLSTAYDPTTVTDIKTAKLYVGRTTPESVAFNADGSYAYAAASAGGSVQVYKLSTAYDLTTAKAAGYVYNYTTTGNGGAITFGDNGNFVFFGGTVDTLERYPAVPSTFPYVGDPIERRLYDNDTVGYIRVE